MTLDSRAGFKSLTSQVWQAGNLLLFSSKEPGFCARPPIIGLGELLQNVSFNEPLIGKLISRKLTLTDQPPD